MEVDGKKKLLEFDALWASGFTDSASRGLPDIETASPDSRLLKIDEMINVTNKPLIVDGDTGGEIAGFEYLVNRLERLGASAVVIEDKIFPKRNSLDPDSAQNLAEPNAFADKVEAGKQAACSRDFMIFAMIASLIAGCGIEDALSRAEKYLCARADGIVVHSNDSDPVRVLKFAQEYSKLCRKLGFCKPLICIPTTYDTIREEELMKYGFRVVIYANYLLRASVKAMQDICQMILLNGRAFETEPYCTPVSKIFEMVGFTEIRGRYWIRLLGQKSS